MLVRKGKVKEVYDIGEEKLKFVFTDNISVFDKIVPTKIKWKGAVLCETACFWFERCNRIGIKNHFLEREKMNEMIVRKFDIVDKGEVDKKNYLIPLEMICQTCVNSWQLSWIQWNDSHMFIQLCIYIYVCVCIYATVCVCVYIYMYICLHGRVVREDGAL